MCKYIYYYNYECIQFKFKGLSSVKYRIQSLRST
ncbi:IS3 family transposase [Otariodibacter sp.]